MRSDQPPKTLPMEYADIEFENNAQRLPLVLCLDISSSMAGPPIQMLNDALRGWTQELHDDVSLSYSVEVAVVTFGGQGVGAWKGPHLLDPGRRPARSYRRTCSVRRSSWPPGSR